MKNANLITIFKRHRVNGDLVDDAVVFLKYEDSDDAVNAFKCIQNGLVSKNWATLYIDKQIVAVTDKPPISMFTTDHG